MKEKQELLNDHNWKNKNERYLFEVQKFLDLLDNISNENLRKQIIYQFTVYDRLITELAENLLDNIN